MCRDLKYCSFTTIESAARFRPSGATCRSCGGLYLRNNSLSGPLAPCDFQGWKCAFRVNNYIDFSDNKFSGRVELPCLGVDPCSPQWRATLDNLVLRGNQLCGICSIKCVFGAVNEECGRVGALECGDNKA